MVDRGGTEMSALLILALLSQVSASAPSELYNEGNQLYEEGDYVGAIDRYEAALEASPDPRVLFNLGNAHFKAGHLGRAILAYRRSEFLSPRDPDVRKNLTFVRTYRADKVETRINPLIAILRQIIRFLSLSEAFIGASLTFFLSILCLSWWVLRRGKWTPYAALVLGLGFAYFLPSYLSWKGLGGSGQAVVVVSEAVAYSGPGEDYREVLNVHDGLEVTVVDRRHDFALIQIPGGLGGWVNESAVGEIYAPQKW
jgi:tetratricopeptide (TPR) repeat protein